jgi:SPP1 gp7 family putative phage head morphogenesis protein
MGFALEKTYTAKTIERKMYKLSIKIFNSLKRQVMKNLKKADKTFKKHLKKQMPLAAIDIIMPDIGDVQYKWENTFEPFLEEEYQEVGNTALRKLRKRMKKYQYETKEAEDIFNVANPMTSQTIKNQMNKIVGASDRVYTKLKDEMMIDLLNGENIQKIQDTVTNVMGKAPMEAMRIARTESNRVANLGTFHSYETEDLVIGYEWLAIIDDGTRDSHIAMNGTRKKKGETFGNGMMFPMDEAASAGEVVNCRCTALPLLDDKELAEGLPEEVVAVEAPQVKPTGAGAKWNTTNKEEAKWHNKAGWKTGTPLQKKINSSVKKTSVVPKVLNNMDETAHSAWNGDINMSEHFINKGTATVKRGSLNVWRHEFAHHIDADPKFNIMYAREQVMKNGTLSKGFAQNFEELDWKIGTMTKKEILEAGFYPKGYGGLTYSMTEDAIDDLKNLRKQQRKSISTMKKRPDKWKRVSWLDNDNTTEWRLRDEWLDDWGKSVKGKSSKEIRDIVKKRINDSDSLLKWDDVEELIGKRLDTLSSSEAIKTSKQLLRLESGQANTTVNVVKRIERSKTRFPNVGKTFTSATQDFYDMEYGSFADYMGGLSKNQFGWGHPTSYYNATPTVIERTSAKAGGLFEMFAEYTELATGKNGAVWQRVFKRISPKSVERMDDIYDFIDRTDMKDWRKYISKKAVDERWGLNERLKI